MRICITGACGHIGSKLMRNINFSDVEQIHLVDNLSTQRYCSLFDLPDNKKYLFHEMDFMSKEMEEIVKDSDIIIHLAAITNAEESVKNKYLVDKTNKQGTQYIAKICSENGKKLIFPSTTSVYGTSKSLVDENCGPEDLHPQSPYAESKIFSERILQGYTKDQMRFVILRFGTIFGYSLGMRFHTAVNKFLWQAINGQKITVWKTALHQKRPYLDIDDCVGAINYVIENNVFDNEIYNIVTLNSTVDQILSALKEFIPDLDIAYVDSPIMNQLSYEVSNKKSIARGMAYVGNLKHQLSYTMKKLRNIHYRHA